MDNNISFSAASDHSSIGNVRSALASLHSKVAMLEKDRDGHATVAARARSDHDDYKMRMEAEVNRERMIAAERERQLLEDFAAAEAEIQHLKERLRAASLHPLPQRGIQTDADLDFQSRAERQLESEQLRISDAEHEISKLEAERRVLVSANSQLDEHIQHLLRSNEELLQMLRIAPRKASPMANPATARGAAECSRLTNMRPSSSSSSMNNLPLGPSTSAKNSMIYQNSPVKKTNFQNSSAKGLGRVNNTSVERETMSSVHRNQRGSGNNNSYHRDPSSSIQMSTFDRLAQPRSCSRNRATSPPHMNKNNYSGRGVANGTAKDTARRFLTQELRSHSNHAVPQ